VTISDDVEKPLALACRRDLEKFEEAEESRMLYTELNGQFW
jgi:hypothetical protein